MPISEPWKTGEPLLPKSRHPANLAARLAGIGWALLAVTIFSGWFVVTRFSVTRELQVWDITALRFGIGALVLAPAILRPHDRPSLRAWGNGLLFALLWGAPFVLLVALGLKRTSAAQAASIAPALMPVFAGVIAWAILHEAQGWRRWLGYLAIMAGLTGLIWSGNGHVLDFGGIGALAAAAAMWSVYTLLFRRSGLTAIKAAALICIWSAVLYIPLYLAFDLARLQRAAVGEIAFQAFYQGVLMSGVAIVTYNRAVALLGPSAATAIIALIPAAAALLGIPVLHEIPTLPEGVAIAAIVLGVLLASHINTPVASNSPTT